MGKKCQSCGMPLKDNREQLGSDADGSSNGDYCCYCYRQGEFTQPDFNAADMQRFCIVKLKELGFPYPLAWLFTRNIPKLKRWSGS